MRRRCRIQKANSPKLNQAAAQHSSRAPERCMPESTPAPWLAKATLKLSHLAPPPTYVRINSLPGREVCRGDCRYR